MSSSSKVLLPKEVLEMMFDAIDQEDVGYILEYYKETGDDEGYNILLEIAIKAGKVQP